MRWAVTAALVAMPASGLAAPQEAPVQPVAPAPEKEPEKEPQKEKEGATAQPGQPIAPVGVAQPGQPIAPVQTRGATAPAGAGQPIGPVGTGRAPTILVPARISGDSEGDASARVGFGLLYGFGEATDPVGWDLGVVAGLEVATQGGLGTLVGFGGDEVGDEPSAGLRLSVSLARLDLASPGGTAYPPLVLYAGGQVSRAPFTYLGPGPRRRVESAPPTLALQEVVEVPWSAGAAMIAVVQGRRTLVPTFEAEAGFASRWTPSARTATWCTPIGEVVRPGDPASSTSTFDPAESCTTAALGAPGNSQELTLAAYAGAIEKAAGATWRASIGFAAAIPMNEAAAEDFRLGLRAPFYLTLARAPEGTDYRGLIRLTPAIEVRRLTSGTTDIVGFLELSLLGQRGLFPDLFDDTP